MNKTTFSKSLIKFDNSSALPGLGLIYEIVMLVFLCQDSQVGPNKYGDSPKYTTES